MYIDVNVSFGSWPFQLGCFHEIASLTDHLARNEIDHALVSHFGAVFYPDADHYNKELFRLTAEVDALTPVPTLNLGVPGWEDHLRSYRDEHEIRTVTILPSYHFFKLESEQAAKLANLLQEWNLPLILRMRHEDERNQYQGLSVEGVPTDEIVAFHQRFPELKVLCLNAYLPEVIAIAETTAINLAFDLSFAERSNSLDTLLGALPPERLFFGSHTPILYTKSSLFKVHYSAADAAVREQVAFGNARSWFFPES